jgi:UDP-glucose 4-epimerase
VKLLATGGGRYIRSAVGCITGQEIEAVEAPRRAGDPPVLVAPSQKIHDKLGWTPQKPDLEAMISDARD